MGGENYYSQIFFPATCETLAAMRVNVHYNVTSHAIAMYDVTWPVKIIFGDVYKFFLNYLTFSSSCIFAMLGDVQKISSNFDSVSAALSQMFLEIIVKLNLMRKSFFTPHVKR